MKKPKGWKEGTLYTMGDRLPYGHKLFKYQDRPLSFYPPNNGQYVAAIWSREYREPKKGEFYLSGCEGFVTAYIAPNDFSTKYFIALPVLVEAKTVTHTKIIEGS